MAKKPKKVEKVEVSREFIDDDHIKVVYSDGSSEVRVV
jgi:hypothetical protein